MHDKQLYERLIAKVAVDDAGCWIWQASKRTDGYGQIAFRRKPRSAHRVMWFALYGEWFARKADQLICHTCDVRPCVNPAHLWKGTALENNTDRDQKGRNYWRSQTKCKYGHEYTPENTCYQHGGRGRYCRKCNHIGDAIRREKKRIELGTKRRLPVIEDSTRTEALSLVAQGVSYTEISERLHISIAQLYRARIRAGLA